MFLGRIFTAGKMKQRLLEERQQLLDLSINKSAKLQEENKELQKSAMEIAWKNHELNQELKKLVADNEQTKNLLLERENKIRTTADELDERKTEVRKSEIIIEARKAEVRKNEQLIADKESQLTKDLNSVTGREKEAKEIKAESEEAKAKYQELHDELETQKENIKASEQEALRKNKEAAEKEATANSIFDRAKNIDAEIKEKEAKFEEYRETIESSLKEKIAEYDRRIEDLNSVKELVNDIKFDDSEDGKAAKIVVKETIRQAKKTLSEASVRFDELDAKYCGGTFKGFSTPLSEIDRNFEDLKTQYKQIKEHIETNQALPNCVNKWLNGIEDCIVNADRCMKSWEFSEGYRYIVSGISACKNYELLLQILNDWGGESSEDTVGNENQDFNDWYEVFEIDPNATMEEIKKQFKTLAKKYHPDKAPGDKQKEYHDKMTLINQAYEVLSDPLKREEFDNKRNYK